MKFFDTLNLDKSLPDHMCLLLNSSDGYKDVRDLFLAAYNEYCDNGINIPIIINSESNVNLNNSCFSSSNLRWGARLIYFLKNIETDYVLMVFDDFVLEDYFMVKNLENALSVLINDSKSAVFYLNAACVSSHDDEPNEDYRLLKDRVDFKVNSVPAIWKREILLKYVSEFDSPWSWEAFSSYKSFGDGYNYYSVSSQSKNMFPYNYFRGGAIYRGKWVKEVVEGKFNRYNLFIDPNVRGFVDYSEKVKRSFSWKFHFLLSGFRKIKLSMFIFLFRHLKKKLSRSFNIDVLKIK